MECVLLHSVILWFSNRVHELVLPFPQIINLIYIIEDWMCNQFRTRQSCHVHVTQSDA